MKRARTLLLYTLVALFGAPDLHAWGPVGHQVVVRIALSQMTPEAQALVRDLLADEDPVEASNWADRVRSDRPNTYNWHFVDVPYGEHAYEPARDCRQTDSGDCVIAAIARERNDVVDRRLPGAARADALRFLLHFVGDLHQPLHAIDNHDRGGNDVLVAVDGYTPPPDRTYPLNLHGVWDSVLIEQRGLDAAAYADLLIERLLIEPLRDPDSIDVVAWALEGHDLAERYVYAYPGFSPAGPPEGVVPLDGTYQRIGQAVIDRQLVRAGVRLARVLDEAARRAQ